MVLPAFGVISDNLDKGFTQATRRLIETLGNLGKPGSPLAARLDELEAEANRLAAAGERLKPDDPAVKALLAQLRRDLMKERTTLFTSTQTAQEKAIALSEKWAQSMALPEDVLLRVGWNRPDPEAVRKLLEFVDQPSFDALINGYPDAVIKQIKGSVLRAFLAGRGPGEMSELIRDFAKTVPAYRAQAIARTLQLQSWRDATALHYQANARIVTHMIRVETLDRRCCMACLALHGQRIELGQRIKGHWNCRGTAIGVTRFMPRQIQTGEDWFKARPESAQRAQMGEAAYAAWKAGKVRLSDFVENVADPVFGEMIREASLKGMLGADAKQYYGR